MTAGLTLRKNGKTAESMATLVNGKNIDATVKGFNADHSLKMMKPSL